MKVNISIECNTEAELANIVAKLSGPTTGSGATAKPKTEAKPKAKVEEEKTDAEVDLGFGDEDTKEDAPAPKKLKLEDVIQGFKEYAQKNSREAAGKLLGKHGVTSVRDLKEPQFEKVMKDLSK